MERRKRKSSNSSLVGTAAGSRGLRGRRDEWGATGAEHRRDQQGRTLVLDVLAEYYMPRSIYCIGTGVRGSLSFHAEQEFLRFLAVRRGGERGLATKRTSPGADGYPLFPRSSPIFFSPSRQEPSCTTWRRRSQKQRSPEGPTPSGRARLDVGRRDGKGE
ncbi:hypothetical protein GGR52DRAFT_224808 [Hypoxylon sp. FL1284]|nr:hypothetical protein GGR52DRAFT_224808 [Hypoxylon sp. FL1284]